MGTNIDRGTLPGNRRGLDGCLQRRTEGNGLVGVDVRGGLLLEKLLEHGAHHGHAGGAACEQYRGDRGWVGVALLENLPCELAGAIDQIGGEPFELLPGHGKAQHLVLVVVEDVDPRASGQADLRADALLTEVVVGGEILEGVEAVLFLKGCGGMLDQSVVPVLASKQVVTRGGHHVDLVPVELDQGHVEGAAAKVVHEDLSVLTEVVQPVGEGSGRRLIDQLEDLEPRHLAGPQRRAPLDVVEVGGDRDHGLVDPVSEAQLGVVLELAENEAGKHLGVVALPAIFEGKPVVVADMALDELHHLLGVHDRRLLGVVADDDVIPFKQNHGGGDAVTLRIREQLGNAVLVHIGDGRKSCPKVNSHCSGGHAKGLWCCE